ncbi:MAG TPA: PBP1A family penicillin-binding protein [Stellaceae bacterium]|jgi:penicillin-binding protein 1A|nr:PBP1A family penicillin-binding protein [Stellaceae bacterium]
MLRTLRGLARLIFIVVIVAALLGGAGAGVTVWHFGRDLPDQKQLLSYQPPTGTRVYAAGGQFMAEFADEHRILTPIGKVPPLIVHAFLAAEDREFFSHGGVNPFSIIRAAVADLVRFRRGQRPLGASTITQQLVRHFLLTNEVSVARKIKEALLAYRIERYLSKDRILEIYLNEIYLGAGAYGVAAASHVYFGKGLDQLTPAEAATLAALPKAPQTYNPLRNPVAAKTRRDWVLEGMAEMGWLSPGDARAAAAEPLRLNPGIMETDDVGEAGYFVEDVRRELIARYGEKLVYEGGLRVETSYTSADQAMAVKAFRDGLIAYDRRHGWRGPLQHLPNANAALVALADTPIPPTLPTWQLAAITGIDAGGARLALRYGGQGRIPLDELRWARRTLPDQRLGMPVRGAGDVVVPGDLVLVERLPGPAPNYGLRQIPDVSGAVVVMDPKTGRVLADVGGWDFKSSQFDRGTQAKRQPGSSIKPFVYVTALQGNFTPSSMILDAPISLPQGPGMPEWTPVNYEGTSVGPTTLRQALVHSRNLATARLASIIGLPSIARTVESFGIMDKMPLYYSMALGAGDTTPLKLTTAYAMLDNGGHWLRSSMIDQVRDRDGRILYQKGADYCTSCYVVAGPRLTLENDPTYSVTALPADAHLPNAAYAANPLLYRQNKPDPLIDAVADYQIVSMMQDVVQHGTGIEVAAVGKPLAGKTGTSSEWFDAWFVGFSPNLAAGVFVGFDTPRTLGDGETGGHVAAPIFRDFMKEALANSPPTPFEEPAAAEMVRVNGITGQPAGAEDKNSLLEAFRLGTEPAGYNAPMPAVDQLAGSGSSIPLPAAKLASTPTQAAPGTGTGGLY